MIKIGKGLNEAFKLKDEMKFGNKAVFLECGNYGHQDIHIKLKDDLYEYERTFGSRV